MAQNSDDSIMGIYVHDSPKGKTDNIKLANGDYICLWWDKWIPKREQVDIYKSIEARLRKIVQDGSTFPLYFVTRNIAKYSAEVVDFATVDEYKQVMPEWKKHHPINFQEKFADYQNKTQKAAIVFLCRDYKQLSPGIPIASFNRYSNMSDYVHPARIVAYTSIQTNNVVKNMTNVTEYKALLKDNKNLILTGAPGTGKTYLAKQIAKELIGIKDDDELENSEQYGFVQFHPSYDYTDFVEGLRPTTDDNGNIRFDLRSGVFKAFCEKAKKDFWENNGTKQITEMYNKLIKRIKNGEKIKLQYKTNQGTTEIDKVKGDSVLFKENRLRKLTLQNLIEVGKNYRNKKDLQTCTVNDIDKICGQTGIAPRYWAVLNYLYTEYDDLPECKNYVFVIDEINRGEISKIFGELFFSIDPGYRGEKGAVDTQYANMHEDDEGKFFVPENVYIIGTMNDIDRSVESFDFAMRRRFTWEEITAKQSGENMGLSQTTKDRMEALNKEIAETDGLGQSYQIGGAYFLDANGNERKDGADGKHPDYPKVWDLRLEPLLKEYLRGMPNSGSKLEEFKKAFIL